MGFQRTISRPVSISGVGLHSGQWVKLTLLPARPGRGIVFVRTDLKDSPEILAHFRNVSNTRLCTTLGAGEVSVATVEHLLAALAGAGIDNLVCELDGPEVPILDGSSKPFLDAILGVGVEASTTPRAWIEVLKRIELKVTEKWAVIEPALQLEISGSIDFDHASIGVQEFEYIEGHTDFSEIAAARTFCMLRDVEAMKRMGLARGGSLMNAVVLDDGGILNPEGLRYPNEFVRHKVLDALGDLKLAGVNIQGRIRLHRAGHDLHTLLLAKLFSDSTYFRIHGTSEAEVKALKERTHALAALV